MTSYYNIIYRKEYLIVHPLKFLYGMSRYTGITFLCLLLFATILWSCTKPTEPSKNALTFTIEDASCIETWLSFKRNGITSEVKISLYRNVGTHSDGNTLTAQFNLPENDTVYVDEGLLPNKIYNYEAVFTQGNITIAKLKTTAQTMDTTSSNFTWETFTFGEHSSSVLYDVAIISPENIWCVGEIYMNDGQGNPDPHAYNAVHWDGEKWNLKRILYKGNFWVIRTVFAFNSNDIWFSAFVRYDGNRYIELPIPNILMGWSVNKMWGSSSENLYIVGNNGNIAHYNGSSWRKIESGTELNIYDIYGEQNNKNGDYQIICVAAEHLIGPDRKILIIKNNSVWEISNSNISIGSQYGVWFKSDRKYFVVGNGIYTKENINNNDNWTVLHNGLTPYYLYAVRGTALNNIFICGSYGESLFYNGYYWITFRNTPGFYNSEFLMASIKQNIIAAVGYNSNKGFIAIGKR